MLDYLRKNDIVVVFRLDRLGRSLKDLIDIMNKFKAKNIHFKSISEKHRHFNTNWTVGISHYRSFCRV